MSAASDKPLLKVVKSSPIVTVLTNAHGTLTKSYELADGEIIKHTAAAMYEGVARRVAVDGLAALADLLRGLNDRQALTYGVPTKANVTIVTKDKVKQVPGAIARTPDYFKYPKSAAFLFLDADADHFKQPISTAAEFRDALLEVEPALADAPMLIVASASSFIFNKDTGEQLIGPRGWHALIPVECGTDVRRVGAALYRRSWGKGFGAYMISKNGSLLDRSLIDQSVFQPERIDFAAGARCEPPLEQRRPEPTLFGDPLALFDSSLIADPSVLEDRAATLAMARAKAEKEPEAQRIRGEYVEAEAAVVVERTGCTHGQAVEVVRRAVGGGVLGSGFVLYPEDGDPVTVRTVLAAPESWHGKRFADPIEPEYRDDKRIAYLNMQGPTGGFLYSHAHGGRTFQLGDTDSEWKNRLRVEGQRATPLRDEENVRIVLVHDPILKGLVKFDEFAGVIVLAVPIPGTEKRGDFPRPWTDTDATALVQYIQRTSLPKVSVEKVTSTMAQVARETGTFHPVRDYLKSLEWDGEPRIDTWLQAYVGAHDAPDEYLKAVGAATLIGGVARIYRPGAKVDCAPVFEGGQGTLKSTAICTLAIRDDWFSDSLPLDLGSKDARDHLRGTWIVELPELAQFRKSEIETVKAFMTRRHEKYRPAYCKNEIKFPRQCFFMGSTNDSEYLVDVTGNRRFWPVKCGKIDIPALTRDRDQLWAEAVVRFKAGDKWYLSPDVAKLAESEAGQRITVDPWLPDVVAALPYPQPGAIDTVSPGEILKKMQVPEIQRNPRTAVRVGQILTGLGWRRSKRDYLRGQLFESPPGPTGDIEPTSEGGVGGDHEAHEAHEAHSQASSKPPKNDAGGGVPPSKTMDFQKAKKELHGASCFMVTGRDTPRAPQRARMKSLAKARKVKVLAKKKPRKKART